MDSQNTRGLESCPARDTLLAFLEGTLPGGTLESVADHLSNCPRCEETVEELSESVDTIDACFHRQDPMSAYRSEREYRQLVNGVTDEPPSPSEVLPEYVGRYRVVRLIARGGMGVVYQAIDPALGRSVAVKMIVTDAVTTEGLRRFETEYRASAKLQHTNVVAILDVGQHEQQPFFAMELMKGGSLEQRLTNEPEPPLPAAALVKTLADATQYCHDQGVWHRDLKPSNILFTGEDVPKIADFGIAKSLDTTYDQAASTTRTDTILGTPKYMAPEQARGAIREIGPATDVHALGAILYRLLSGHAPFVGANDLETLALVRDCAPASLLDLLGVNAGLNAICQRCLAKRPDARYASARHLAEDLQRWLNGERPDALRRERALRRRSLLVYAAAAASSAGVLAAAVGRWRARDPGRRLDWLKAELRAGRAVELVGATGLPNWHQVGIESGGDELLFASSDGTAGFRSSGSTACLLLDDSQLSAFHFEADIRNDQSAHQDVGVGLILGYRVHTVAGTETHFGYIVRFNDVRNEDDIPERFKGLINKSPGNLIRLMPYYLQIIDGVTKPGDKIAGDTGRFKPDPSSTRWRRIECDVDLRRLSVRGDFGRDFVGLHLDLPASVGNTRPEIVKQLASEPVSGGIGIYVSNSTASFRNVIIRPLER